MTQISNIQSPLDPNPIDLPRSNVRTNSANNALGFAQVLQAFDTPNEPEIEQSQEDSLGTQEKDSLDTDQDVDSEDDSIEKNEQSQSESKEETSTTKDDSQSSGDGSGQSDSGDRVKNPQENEKTQIDQTTQPTNESDVHVDEGIESQGKVQSEKKSGEPELKPLQSLDVQSAQVKFNLQDVEQKLNHSAQVDLASIASNQRRGRSSDGKMISDSSTKNEQIQIAQGKRVTSESIPVQQEQVPTSDRVIHAHKTDRVDLERTHADQHVPVDAKLDRARSDVQHQRSKQVSKHLVQNVQSGSDVQRASAAQSTQDSGSVQSKISNPLIGKNLPTINQGAPKFVSQTNSESSGIGSLNQVESTQSGGLGKAKLDQPIPQAQRSQMLAQVQKGLASLLKSGKNEMTLKLTPGHLGELRIRFQSDDQQLSVRFETSTNEASQVLRSSMTELTTSLQLRGIELNQIEIHSPEDQIESQSDNQSNDQSSNHADTDRKQHNENAQHQSDTGSVFADNEDDLDTSHDQSSVWTELGLDAIA